MKRIFLTAAVWGAAFGANSQAHGDAIYQRITMGADVMLQLSYPTKETCKASVDASLKQIAEGTPSNGLTFSCSSTDVSSLLPFQVVVRDETWGYSSVVSTRTELLCLNWTNEMSKQVDPRTKKKLFTVLTPCKLQG